MAEQTPLGKKIAVLQASLGVLWGCGCLALALIAGGALIFFAFHFHPVTP